MNKIACNFLTIILLILQGSLFTIHGKAQSLDKLPVIFRKNVGQWQEDILYKANSYGANIYFMKNGLSFGFRKPKDSKGIGKDVNEKSFLSHDQHLDEYETFVWNLHFMNSNQETILTSEQEQDSRTNYLLGNDSSKWKTNIPDYGKIIYHNIYDKTDLRYYGTGLAFKYDFILHPYANVSEIKMACEGIKGLVILDNGDLEVITSWGSLKEKAPVAYQEINGKRISVDVRFVLINDTTYSFNILQPYDPSQTLIIDPVILEWSTFLGGGGNGNGYIFDIAVDTLGFIYATGYYNESFPVTPTAYDTSYNTNGSCGLFGSFEDVFVAKMNPAATALIYATYVGGTCSERGRGIVTNPVGEAFVTGWSKSTDFPMVNAFQSANAGSVDVIAFRLNATGTALIYSTYLGGTYNDWGEKVATDSANNAYYVGASLDNAGVNAYPVTAGSFQPAYGGGMWQGDAYITKLNASGGMVYSSFLGDTLWDWAYDVKVDSIGQAYITGKGQGGFPTTTGAFQITNHGGDDVFVTKINAAGSAIIYSTMVGGSTISNGSCACEVGNYIVINNAGEAYVTGNTRSSNFPTTTGSYQPNYGGGYYGDIFVFKLNATGSNLLYSTYLGSPGLDIGWGLDVSENGNVFVAGYTDNIGFPMTHCSYDTTYNGTNDADFIVAKFNPTLSTLMYSTYIGGDGQDYWEPKIHLSGNECSQTAVFCGTSHSQNFPTTAGVLQPIKLNGVNDQPVIFKLKPALHPGFTHTPANPPCNTPVTFTDTTTSCGNWGIPLTIHSWNFGDNTFGTGVTVTHTYINPGTYTVKLFVGCPMDSIIQTITITSTLPTVTSSFYADTLNGCNPFTIQFHNTSTNGIAYLWNYGDGNTDTATNPNHTYTDSGTYSVTLIAYNPSPCGTVTDTFILHNYITISNNIELKSSFTANPVSGCSPLLVNITNTSTNATSFQWYFGDGRSSIYNEPFHIYDTGKYVISLVVFSNSKCINKAFDSTTYEFIIVDSCNLSIPNTFSPNGDGKNDLFNIIANGYSNYHLLIFNRWGQKVFESNNHTTLWNGKINNSSGDAPDGTYYFIFNAIDINGNPLSLKGVITLIR